MRQITRRVVRRLSMLVLAVGVAFTTMANNLKAATIFESGTLGLTGIPRSEIAGGSNVSPVVFDGVRFHLDQPVITTQSGGHFVKNTGSNDSFFGAIIALANENDFPKQTHHFHGVWMDDQCE